VTGRDYAREDLVLYFADERETSPVDDTGGVARRFVVVHRPTGAMRTVVMVRPDGGRFMAQPSLRCECAFSGCIHVAVVLRDFFHAPTPAAA
jgi:hypothetical protein